MIWCLGCLRLSQTSANFICSICCLLFYSLEFRWALIRMNLSKTATADRSAQFTLFSQLPLRKLLVGYFTLKVSLLAMISVSLVQSAMVQQRPVAQTACLNCSEYSWMKKTSADRLAKFAITLSSLRCSFRKESSQKGRMACRQLSGLCFMSCSKGCGLQTKTSRAWQIKKSQSRVAVLSYSEKLTSLMRGWVLNLWSHLAQNYDLERKRLLAIPVSGSKAGEYLPVLIFWSILPMFQLNFSREKAGKQRGSRERKIQLRVSSSLANSAQQNSKGLFMMPQQLRVTTTKFLGRLTSIMYYLSHDMAINLGNLQLIYAKYSNWTESVN